MKILINTTIPAKVGVEVAVEVGVEVVVQVGLLGGRPPCRRRERRHGQQGGNTIMLGPITRAARRTFFTATRPRRGLLKGVPPLLGPDLLHVLRSAGHGDKIALVDCNFPAAATAAGCPRDEVIPLAGVALPEAVDAICSLMPLDFFIEEPARYMVPTPPNETPPLAQEVHGALKASIETRAPGVAVTGLERFAFYDEAETCFAIVQCVGERRPYGNVILTKGVIGPDGEDLKP